MGLRFRRGPDRVLMAHGPIVRVLLAVSVLSGLAAVAALIIALAGFGGQVNKTTERTDANQAAIAAVAGERRDTIYSGCVDQNRRHDATVAKLKQQSASGSNPLVRDLTAALDDLDALVRASDPSSAARLSSEIQAYDRDAARLGAGSSAPTIALIDALAPRQDCAALVNRQAPVGPGR